MTLTGWCPKHTTSLSDMASILYTCTCISMCTRNLTSCVALSAYVDAVRRGETERESKHYLMNTTITRCGLCLITLQPWILSYAPDIPPDRHCDCSHILSTQLWYLCTCVRTCGGVFQGGVVISHLWPFSPSSSVVSSSSHELQSTAEERERYDLVADEINDIHTLICSLL